jgi:NADH-quinone oxidoreductase subunit N
VFLPQILKPVFPEMAMGILIMLNVLLGSLFADRVKRLVLVLSLFSLLVVWWLVVTQTVNQPQLLFHNMFIMDRLAYLLKVVLLPVVALVLLAATAYVDRHQIASDHYCVLALVSTLGMMVLISAHHFLSLFMGAELMSLPVYAMVALQRDDGLCTEAAIKYFVVGALATGILLFGLSLIFGATRSMDFAVVSQVARSLSHTQLMLMGFGLTLVVVAVAFKLGAAPFHMWVPDVYAGAPGSVTLFIATASKIAALAMALRLLTVMLPQLIDQWRTLLMVVAILSMGVGNLVAIMQTSLRRLLAYSSIAHMGFISLGLISGTAAGYAASCFYLITYVISSLGSFTVVTMLGRGERVIDQIDDLAGLHHRQPVMALVLLLLFFSMAGIPPLVGFWAKLSVLEALISQHLVWLAVLALVFAIVGVYYYIRVIKVIYFDDSKQDCPKLQFSRSEVLVAGASTITVLLLGLFPAVLFHYCRLALS